MLDRGTTDSSFYGEPSFQGPIRASRSQPTTLAVQPPAVRPLSSADEAGPVTKKLRSTVRQRIAPPSSAAADTHLKPSKSTGILPVASGPGLTGDRTKSSKARARPALTIANIFSSSGRPAQNTAASSRSHAVGLGKPATGAAARRSSRLQSGGSKIAKVSKLDPSVLTGSSIISGRLYEIEDELRRRHAHNRTSRAQRRNLGVRNYRHSSRPRLSLKTRTRSRLRLHRAYGRRNRSRLPKKHTRLSWPTTTYTK